MPELEDNQEIDNQEELVTDEGSEETTDEVVESEEEASTEEEEVEEDPAPRPMSRRESLRIQKLVGMLKQNTTNPAAPAPGAGNLNYRDALNADDDTVTQLEEDRKKYGESLYLEGIKKAESIQFRTRLDIDAPRVETQYPQLNPRDEKNFHPALADSINRMYLAAVGYDAATETVTNPNVRYIDYVESVMELAEEIAGEKVAKTTKNIAKQAAATGLRPSGGTAKRMNLNQAPQNMSDEELDAIIAQAIPNKR